VLRVTLEMVPFGQEEAKYLIGVMEIVNVGGTHAYGNYDIRLSNNKQSDGTPGKNRYAHINKFPRKLGGWELVRRVLHKFSPR
jgi:hypothetical protein